MSEWKAVEDRFPKLLRDGYTPTSRATDRYNCVAWVVRETQQWVSPEDVDGFSWPHEVLGDGTSLADYERYFELCGFERCSDGILEAGFERIAIYGQGEDFDHVAFQRDDGAWSSKLGELGDIRHNSLASLEAPGFFEYLPVTVLMKRPREPHPLAHRGLLLPGDPGYAQ